MWTGCLRTRSIIYYAAGESLDKIDKLPQTELLKDKGTEILYFTDEVDEFVAQMLGQYKEKAFRSVVNGELELEEGPRRRPRRPQDAHKAALDFVKETLGDKVKEVKAPPGCKSHPVCLTAGEGLSFEMEKYFQAMQPDSRHQGRAHPGAQCGPPRLPGAGSRQSPPTQRRPRSTPSLLYDQALLIAGLPLDDPSGYTDLVCELMK